MPFPQFAFRWALNPGATPEAAYGPRQAAVLNRVGLEEARRCITAWSGYAATPLVELPDLAGALGVKRVSYKDEGRRFGLRSFKALGGAYAVQRCLLREVERCTGRRGVDPAEILDGRHKEVVAGVTVTAATDGNHGRSVAWGAQMFGCRCVIYVGAAVSDARAQAIAAFGAEVRRFPGEYDDSVREAFAVARREGWHVIPDTSDGSLFEAPRDVMQGYTVMAAEIVEQLAGGSPPTHIFLQAGVGGLAAACCAHFWEAFGSERPFTVVVEPERCACWFASLLDQRPTAITGDTRSFMSGLACGEVSPLAWEILQGGADAMVTLPDAAAEAAMRLIADGVGGDARVAGGESGVAGLAALIAIAQDEEARARFGLGRDAHAVLIGSEGATDEANYSRVVGRSWQEVAV